MKHIAKWAKDMQSEPAKSSKFSSVLGKRSIGKRNSATNKNREDSPDGLSSPDYIVYTVATSREIRLGVFRVKAGGLGQADAVVVLSNNIAADVGRNANHGDQLAAVWTIHND